MKDKKSTKKGQKILIVGGAGYVGSRLVPLLAEKGHDVTVVDLLWFGNSLPKNIKVIKMDVFDVKEDLLKGFDQVIFLAGLSNDPMAEYSPAFNYIYNSAAPSYLAYTAKRAGVKRFIFSGTGSVYGATENRTLNEDDVAYSLHPYGISKINGESGVMYLKDDDFSVVSLRKGTISGWGPRMRFDLIVNTMYMKASTEGKITINNKDIWRPILAITDAINAYALAVSLPIKKSGIYNISSGNFTVGEIGQKVFEHFKKKHKKNIEVEVKNIPDKRNYKISHDRAVRILGYKPKGTVESILLELDKNVGQNFNFKDENCYNISVFKKMLDQAHNSIGERISSYADKKKIL
jgi:nucleoside-diphosphate-sugar epimerase